ncbi:MAG TPA: LamG-like jellyroll fold domain-containing protein, partial [Acidimicrobiales bacterium]|nr:LamG-like jellyroll fold domain-containing protein [Acidimicrobiales bacterium]
MDAGGTLIPAPASVVGVDPARTIEVWVWNPSIAGEETMVSWGRRGGPDGSNMSFNYGNNGDFGAVGHWGSPDIGWGPTVPVAQRWHHLVYSYDRTTTRVYVDGALANTEILGEGAINTHTGLPFNIGTQLNAASQPEPALRGELTLGRVRIYEGVMTPAQVTANYDAEKASYVEPGIPPPPDPVALTAPPVHRYSFNDAAGDASGDQITDSIGGAHGRVVGPLEGSTVPAPTWTGTRLALAGGPSTEAAYGDLPNQLVSKFGTGNGGPGQVTLEAWVRHTGSQSWSRFVDFGFSTAGELEGPGGLGNGTNYLMLTAQTGGDTATHRFELQAAAGNPNNRFRDVNSATFNSDLHFAITWQEASFDPDTGAVIPGRLRLYEQGLEVSTFTSPLFMNELLDVNNWLGRSNYTGDGNFQGEYDEFRVYDRVLTAQEVRGNFLAGPDIVTGGTPVVVETYVRGATWLGQDNNPATTTFMEYLESKGLGDDVMGYRLYGTGRTPPASNPEDIIPWINADQIVVRYSSPPTGSGIPTPGTVTVAGLNPAASSYTVTNVAQVPGDPTAYVLTLNKPLGGGNPVTGVAPTVSE